MKTFRSKGTNMSESSRRRVEQLLNVLQPKQVQLPVSSEYRVISTTQCVQHEIQVCGGQNGIPFEKWTVGNKYRTARRTISESDVINYVNLTGYNSENLFRDMEYLKSVGHPKRLAPGLLTLSIADALIVGSGVLEQFAVALVGVTGFRALKPVYAGDTIHVELEVTETSLHRKQNDRGIVTTVQTVINQAGEVVAKYKVSRMIKCTTSGVKQN